MNLTRKEYKTKRIFQLIC